MATSPVLSTVLPHALVQRLTNPSQWVRAQLQALAMLHVGVELEHVHQRTAQIRRLLEMAEGLGLAIRTVDGKKVSFRLEEDLLARFDALRGDIPLRLWLHSQLAAVVERTLAAQD